MAEQILAAAVLVIFYSIYYGKQCLQKKKGIQTYQLQKQKKGEKQWVARGMGLATVLVVVVEIISIAMHTQPLPLWARVLGLVQAFLGDGVFLLAVCTMGDSWRAGVSGEEKTQLITHGIYRFSRNPAFLGFDLVYLGLLLTYFNWVHLAVALAAAVLLHLQVVLVEEPYLPEAFGEEYLQYRRKVCRYFGRRCGDK